MMQRYSIHDAYRESLNRYDNVARGRKRMLYSGIGKKVDSAWIMDI